MKIGILMSNVSRIKSGGVYELCKLLAKYLNQRDELDVNVFGLRDLHTKDCVSDFHNENIPLHTYKTFFLKSFGYAPYMGIDMLKHELDIIHLHGLWMYPSLVCSNWSNKTLKPYIISPHGMLDNWAVKNSSLKKKLVGGLFENKNIRNASCIHVGSLKEYESVRRLGIRTAVSIIPNGVEVPDSEFVYSNPSWFNLLPKNSKILLYLGRIHPKKGLENLLRSWSELDKKNINGNWVLVIAGEGEKKYEQYLIDILRENQISSVYFVGPQYEIKKYESFRASSAFILPSYSEGMSIVALEAMSFSLPVLMTPECNMDYAFDCNAAIRIEPNEFKITQKLVSIFSMKEAELKFIGNNGKSFVEKYHNWSRLSEDMMQTYRWILNKGDKPKCVVLD
jgi:glycosyltransferase involved in cell wall biosynthesis